MPGASSSMAMFLVEVEGFSLLFCLFFYDSDLRLQTHHIFDGNDRMDADMPDGFEFSIINFAWLWPARALRRACTPSFGALDLSARYTLNCYSVLCS